MKLYLVDETTLRLSSTEEVETEDELHTIPPDDAWILAGKSGKVLGSFWAPPSDEYVYDGVGWRLPPPPDELAVLLLSGHSHFTVEYVEKNGLTPQVLPAVLRLKADLGWKESYTQQEVSTFPVQLAEAQGVLKDSSFPTPILSAIATAEGRSVTELANVVVAKHEQRTTAMAEFLSAVNLSRRAAEASDDAAKVTALRQLVAK